MKKFLLSIALIVLGCLSAIQVHAQSVTFDDSTTWTCDQYFAPAPVRYRYTHTFYDDFNNPTPMNLYLTTFAVQYKNASYLSADGVFAWTDTLRAAGFTSSPGTSVRAITTNSNW